MDGFLWAITRDTQTIVGFSHAFIIADELCDLEARSMSIRQVAIDLEGDVDLINVAKSHRNTFRVPLGNAAHFLKWYCKAQTRNR